MQDSESEGLQPSVVPVGSKVVPVSSEVNARAAAARKRAQELVSKVKQQIEAQPGPQKSILYKKMVEENGKTSVHLDIRGTSQHGDDFRKQVSRSLNATMKSHFGFADPRTLLIKNDSCYHYEYWIGNIDDVTAFVGNLREQLKEKTDSFKGDRHGEYLLHVAVNQNNEHHMYFVIIDF